MVMTPLQLVQNPKKDQTKRTSYSNRWEASMKPSSMKPSMAVRTLRGVRTSLLFGGLLATVGLSSVHADQGGIPAQVAALQQAVQMLQQQVRAQNTAITQLTAVVNSQSQLIGQLQQQNQALQATLGCMSKTGNDVYFTGCNVHVVNGTGNTTESVNGLGNLIVGYNEDAGFSGFPSSVRTGSHNLVLGVGNSYSSSGGIVGGNLNTISAAFATVIGGLQNTASGQYSVVMGGQANNASGNITSISGGSSNSTTELGTSIICVSGGEPLLHPELDQILARIRQLGSICGLITNGYLLTKERIESLNRAGLQHLQISIDNVMPDEVSKKSLKVLDKKLELLAEYAEFHVNINSVVGGGIHNPQDALVVANRALDLGLTSTVGIIHDHDGQLEPLGEVERDIFVKIRKMGKASFGGIQKRVCLEWVPDVGVGDYVIVHVGFAISKMDEKEAMKTLELFEQMEGAFEELKTPGSE